VGNDLHRPQHPQARRGPGRLKPGNEQHARFRPNPDYSRRLLGKPSDPGRTGGDGRRFLEAVLWIARTGAPWRDLPEAFGNWNTVFKRFRYWVKLDVFQQIFDAVSDEPDMEFAMIDGTIVKVHRHGQGSKGGLKARPSADPKAAGPPRSSR
jgi:transposase